MTTRRRKLRTWSRKHLTRDWVMRIFGLAGFAYETIVTRAERPTLLLGFLAMMGLPQFLNHDEAAQPPKEPPPVEPPKPDSQPAGEAK